MNRKILDTQENPSVSSHNTALGILGGITYIIGGLAALVGLYGYWLSISTLQAPGAPDAEQFAHGTLISLLAQWICIGALSIGLICQMTAFYRYAFRPPWMRITLWICGGLAVITSIIPLQPVPLILGIIMLVHVYGKQAFYQDEEL